MKIVFQKVTHFENSVEELAKYIVNQSKIKEITHFCGNLKRDEFSLILMDNDVVVNEVEVYRTLHNTRKYDEKFDGVMFYSPSGIKSYVVDNANRDIVAFCIGNTTAVEAKKYFNKVEVAVLPTIENVIKLVNQYYE